MEEYIKGFRNLSINTKNIKDISSPSPGRTDFIKNKLINFYKNFDIYTLYGSEQIDYVCSLATNYALWTLPPHLRSNDDIVGAYTHWLSIIWIIDSSFDTFKSKNLCNERDVLVDIIKKLIDGVPVHIGSYVMNKGVSPKAMSKHDKLMLKLPDIVHASYSKYLSLISVYRNNNIYSFKMVNEWTFKYFDNLVENDDNNIKKYNLDHYGALRLVDGAIMCVCWHIMLFMDVPCSHLNDDHIKLFELTSILVAYHNDILSYHRDVKQNTNNLIKCIMHTINDNYNDNNSGLILKSKDNEHGWIKYYVIKSIEYVNNIYKDLCSFYTDFIHKYPNDAKVMHDLCMTIIKGSHNWANNEKRYESGIKMVKSIETNDDNLFNSLFDNISVVYGDPVL